MILIFPVGLAHTENEAIQNSSTIRRQSLPPQTVWRTFLILIHTQGCNRDQPSLTVTLHSYSTRAQVSKRTIFLKITSL